MRSLFSSQSSRIKKTVYVLPEKSYFQMLLFNHYDNPD